MTNLNRNILWGLGIVLFCATAYYFSDILTFILIAWVISMLGRPLLVWYKKHLKIGNLRLGDSAASLLTIVSFYLIMGGILYMFVPTIVSQARNLATVDYAALGERLRVPFANLDAQMHQIGLLHDGESLASKLQEVLSVWFKPTLLGDFVGSFIGIAGNILVTFSSVTFILFFFLKENRLFLDILHAIVPTALEEKVVHAVQDSSEVLTRYFGGLLIQTLSFAAMVTILCWIFGIQNALLIGAFGGIFNIIPYVGPIMGMIFGAFITVSSHVDIEFALLLPMLLKVAAAFMITQAIDNSVLGPLIFSKSVQAHPLEIFIVTLASAKIGGVLGMVLGIPVYTVLRAIARIFFSEFKLVKRLTEHLDEET
jgi:predicted PurR-regulated permease PerM